MCFTRSTRRKGSEKGLRRGSKKGLSRRHLEGRNTPFREYDPVGVRPKGVKSARGEAAIPRRGDHTRKHVWNIPSHSLLQINDCTRNSRNKLAIVLRP